MNFEGKLKQFIYLKAGLRSRSRPFLAGAGAALLRGLWLRLLPCT